MFGAYGGYIFKDWFALEASLYSTDELADNQANLVSADLLVLSVTPKFIYSVNDAFSLHAKTGVSFMFYEEEYNNFILNQRGYDQSWSGTGVTIGLGAQYSFTTGISISANYDWTTAELDSDDEWYYNYAPDVEIDLNRISIGAHYRFK